MERLEKTLALIKLYKEKEELWNMQSPLYKSSEAKQRAYQDIACEMEISANDVKKKIKSIRTVYVAEKSKVEKSIESEQCPVYEPKLAWFKKLNFLDDCIYTRKFKQIKTGTHSQQSNDSTKDEILFVETKVSHSAKQNKRKVDAPEVSAEKQFDDHNIATANLLQGENYKVRFGEVFFTTFGRVIFQCLLCEDKFVGYNAFVQHWSEIHEPKEERIEYEALNEHSIPEINLNVEGDELFEMKDVQQENEIGIKLEEFLEDDVDVQEPNKFGLGIEADGLTEDIVYESDAIETNYTIERLPRQQYNKSLKSEDNKQQKREPLDEDAILLDLNIETVREVEKRIFPRSLLTKEEERKHKCPLCGLGFKERHNMIHHLKRHSNKKNYKCSTCGKAFYTYSECRIHNTTHTKERRYLCSICGKSYAYSTQLADHLRRHGPEKPLSCEICKKGFYDKGDLTEHMASHSSERPFSCEICSATFSRQGALRNHKKLHENKREYKCRLCSMDFNQRAGLFSHMKTAHQAAKKGES